MFLYNQFVFLALGGRRGMGGKSNRNGEALCFFSTGQQRTNSSFRTGLRVPSPFKFFLGVKIRYEGVFLLFNIVKYSYLSHFSITFCFFLVLPQSSYFPSKIFLDLTKLPNMWTHFHVKGDLKKHFQEKRGPQLLKCREASVY